MKRTTFPEQEYLQPRLQSIVAFLSRQRELASESGFSVTPRCLTECLFYGHIAATQVLGIEPRTLAC